MIRYATLSDMAAIAEVKQATWPKSHLTLDQIRLALQSDNHVTVVAVINDKIVGYMACFLTITETGKPRWEMDELAVHPAYRQRGIGSQLVLAGTQAGRQHHAIFARALIQIENIGSQRSFAKAGYHLCPEICGLFISTSPPIEHFVPPANLHLVPVVTLGYCGVWIEGHRTYEGFIAAREKMQGVVAGAVIPLQYRIQIQTAKEAAFTLVDQYQWWHLDL